MATLPHTPRRKPLTSHYNWCSRYQGLNNKKTHYEMRMLDLIDMNGADPQDSQAKRAYTRALHAWKKVCHSLVKHMSEPV
jgi:hypothetical protein